jgi:hypothetical protein
MFFVLGIIYYMPSYTTIHLSGRRRSRHGRTWSRGLASTLDFRCNLLLSIRWLLLRGSRVPAFLRLTRIQEPRRHAPGSKRTTAHPRPDEPAPLVVAPVQALNLLEGVAVVIRQARLWVAVAGWVVGYHAERRVGGFCDVLDDVKRRKKEKGERNKKLTG